MKVKMVGCCARCGKEHVQNPPVDAVVCTCGNPDFPLVTLYPTLLLSKSEYAKFWKISQVSGIPIEQLVNALLFEAAQKRLESLPGMTWRVEVKNQGKRRDEGR